MTLKTCTEWTLDKSSTNTIRLQMARAAIRRNNLAVTTLIKAKQVKTLLRCKQRAHSMTRVWPIDHLNPKDIEANKDQQKMWKTIWLLRNRLKWTRQSSHWGNICLKRLWPKWSVEIGGESFVLWTMLEKKFNKIRKRTEMISKSKLN